MIYFEIGNVELGITNAIHINIKSDVLNLDQLSEVLKSCKALFAKNELQSNENSINLHLFFKEAYASYKNIFQSSLYVDFKACLIKIFPNLEEQFSIQEDKALVQEELFNSLNELQEYQRHGFFGSKDYIETLKQRIHYLENKI